MGDSDTLNSMDLGLKDFYNDHIVSTWFDILDIKFLQSNTLPDYKSTLNLPKTDFAMQAGLPKKEPVMLEKWYEDKVYEKMHCHECGYHEIKERPVYRYDPKKYERKRLDL